jgi:tRNA pseudouridine55 synthase
VSGVSGVLVVDKPAGPTSHDAVDRVRKVLGTRRVGHTGTLDPFATGVLAVCVGKATRLSRFLMDGEKVYEAGVRFGFATSTDDFTGEPLGVPATASPSRDEVEAAARAFVGGIDQVPPAYSAKRVAGRKMYELARRGEAVTAAPSRVVVHEIRVGRAEGAGFQIEVRCSAGTYIRALARDLGAALGVGGHLVSLRRTRSGEFGVEDALSWEELLGPAARERLVPLSRLLPVFPEATVGEPGREAVRHGRPIEASHLLVPTAFPEGQRVRVADPEHALLALAVATPDGRLRADVVLAD